MKIYLSVILSFLVTLLYSQDKLLKEVTKFYENGKPETIQFKNLDLEVVQVQRLDEKGKPISNFYYNPKTKLKNGDFYNLFSKGTYIEGVLNSSKFVMNIDPYGLGSKDVFWEGEVKNGRPIGEIQIYKLQEKFEVTSKLNVDISTQMSMNVGYKMRYYDNHYKKTGLFEKTLLTKLNYNEEGNLEGIQKINNKTSLFFENGKLMGYTILNENSNKIVKDSVFRNNKLWKRDNKFIKNNGFNSKLIWNEFNPTSVKFEEESFFGSSNSENQELNSNLGQNIFLVYNDLSPNPNENGFFYKYYDLITIGNKNYRGNYREGLKKTFVYVSDPVFEESGYTEILNLSDIFTYKITNNNFFFHLPFINTYLIEDKVLKTPSLGSFTGLKEIINQKTKGILEDFYRSNKSTTTSYIKSLKNIVEHKYINLSEIWIFNGKFVDYFEQNNSKKISESEIKNKFLIKEEEKRKQLRDSIEEENRIKEKLKLNSEKRINGLRKLFNSKSTFNQLKVKSEIGKLNFTNKFPDILNEKSKIENGIIKYNFEDEFGIFEISIKLIDKRNSEIDLLTDCKYNPGLSSTQTEEGLQITSIWKGTDLSGSDVNLGDTVKRINNLSVIYPFKDELCEVLSNKSELTLTIKSIQGSTKIIKVNTVLNYSGKKGGEFPGKYKITGDKNGLLYSLVFGEEKKQPELKILYKPKNPEFDFNFESEYLYRFSYFFQELMFF